MCQPIPPSMTMAEAVKLLCQPLFASPETPLLTVLAGLAKGDSPSALPTAEPPAELCVVMANRRVVGLLTLGDVGRLIAQRQCLDALTVGEVMTQPVITLPQWVLTQPWEALDFMHQHHIRHLPVLDEQGELMGVLTQTSLLQGLSPLGLYKSLGASATAAPATPKTIVPPPMARRRSEVMMTKLAATVPGTLYVLDHPAPGKTHLTYISPQALDLYGLPAEAMVRDPLRFMDLIHPEDRAGYGTALEASATAYQPFFYEYRIVTPTGQEKWMRAHGQPEPLPQGGVRWFGVALDITDRKRAEQNLHLASQRLQEAQRIAQIGNWEMDLWTNTLHWSEEIFRIFEIDDQQFGASYEAFLQTIHPDDRAGVHEAYTRHLWDQQPYKLVHRLQFPDGRTKYVQEQCETLYRDDGSPYLSRGTVQDVTELKQAQIALEELNSDLERRVAQRTLALRQSEARYRQIIETANEGVWLLDAEARHVFGNPALFAILGTTADAMANRSLYDYIAVDGHAQVQALLQRCEAGQAEQEELPLRRPDQTLRWAIAAVSPMFSEAGQYAGVLAMVTDITERRLAEETIHQENTFRRLILDNLTEGICVCHASPSFPFVHFSVWNPQMEVITGYSQEDINRLGWYQSLYPDPQVRQRAMSRMDEMRLGHNLMAEEWEIRHRDGTPRTVTITTTLLSDAQGQNNVLAVMQDITERKQAERRIQQQIQQEALLREITQHIRQSLELQVIFNTACQEIRQVLGADRVGIFRFELQSGCSDGAFVAESLGEGIMSVLALPVHDHCFGETYAPQYIQGRYAAMDDVDLLEECHTSVLAEFQVKANLVLPLVCGDSLWGLLCIHQCHHRRHWEADDIALGQQLAAQLAIAIQQATLYDQLQTELAERQQAQTRLTHINQELAQSNQELARATRLKDEFLANMSHELRTPLNAIMGMTEGMQEEVFGPITPEQHKSLQTVENSAAHLLSLINDILDVAKIEAGQIELEIGSVAVAPLCSSTLAFIKQQALKKQIQINTHLPAILPNLWADERRVRQALLNLLTNAVKFTPPQGCVSLTVSLVSAEAEVDQTQAPQADASPDSMTPATPEDSADSSDTQTIDAVQATEDANNTATHPDSDPALEAASNPDLSTTTHPKAKPVAPSSHFLRFAVADTGIGISPENIARLFRPFVQIDSALNRQYAGTGLGLALVKQIAELHGGRVHLTSELGQGSCFSLDFPCDPQSLSTFDLVNLDADATEAQAPCPAVAPVILLAEDNEANISTIASYLRAKGYTLRLAYDGQQAIDQAQTDPPDMILMDIQMPGMDGFTAMEHLRRIPTLAQVPIIALTALTMAHDEDRCLTAGANAYLSKPVRLKQLANLIHSLLSSSSSPS